MKIQLKRSNVLESSAAKQPTAGQMEYGELAVNYNTNDPAIFLKDSNNQIIRISGAGAEGTFSGDYNDLTNKPTIGDGTLTINDADGAEVATFTANQEGPTLVTLPAGFSGDFDDLTNKPGLQEVTDINSETTNGITAAEFNPGATGAGNFRIDLLPNIATAPKA